MVSTYGTITLTAAGWVNAAGDVVASSSLLPGLSTIGAQIIYDAGNAILNTNIINSLLSSAVVSATAYLGCS